MLTVCFGNFKGGVGKTTLAVHCAHAWARRLGDGAVQLVDNDPQRNANLFLPSMPQVLAGAIQDEVPPGVKLRIIDTPPTMGAALFDAMKQSRFIVVPFDSEMAINGFLDLAETIKEKRGQMPMLRTFYIFTMADRRLPDYRAIYAHARTRCGTALLDTIVVERIDYQRAAKKPFRTVFDYAPQNPAAREMQAVCDELWERMGLEKLVEN